MDVEFRYGKLAPNARFLLAFALYLGGTALQLASGLMLPGFALVVLGWAPLALRKITTKPSDQGLEEWRAVSAQEIDRIADALKASRKTSISSGLDLGRAILVTGALAMAAALGGLLLGGGLALALADFCLFLVPALFFGRVKVFVPKELKLKLPCIAALLAERYPKDIILTPYLRFDKDAKGLDVPEDVRAMLEPKRKPTDLVGVQLQAAINNGENGEVPYLYAVFIFKGSSGAGFRAVSRLKARGYVVEANAEGEYGTVVVRQETGGGGYRTTPDDCAELVQLATKALETLAQAG